MTLDKSKIRIKELDGLRGIAAMSVLAFHYLTKYDLSWGHAVGFWPRFPWGHYGVQLFFIISGFVISMTLSKTVTIIDFLANRFCRLYPVYWVAVTVTFSCLLFFPIKPAPYFIEYLLNLTMLNNVINPFLPHGLQIASVDGVYWTLQIELFFYALFLIPFYFGQLKTIEWWAAAWVCARLAVLLMPDNFFTRGIAFIGDLHYADLFSAGVVFFQCRLGGLKLIHIFLLSFFICSRFLLEGLESSLVVLACYGLFFAIHFDRARLLNCRWLVFLGTISYSLYLTHQMIGYCVIYKAYRLEISPWCGVLAASIVSIALASILTFIIEKPTNHILRKVWEKQKRPELDCKTIG
ncbi:MAG: acyltransferase [Verrucomicrobiota bacterium]